MSPSDPDARPLPETPARLAALAEENVRLQAEVARLRRLVEANIVGIEFWDFFGTVSDANDAFLQICGYTREELREGKIKWTALTPPEYLPLDQHAIDEMRRTGKCAPYEKEYIHKDGTRIPVLMAGAMIDDSTDAGVAFVLDMRRLKNAEKAVRDKEARIRRLFESSLIGIILGNPDTGQVEVNDAFLKIVGYTREEFQAGKVSRQALAPPDYPQGGETTVRCQDAECSTYEKEYLRKDGTRVPVLVGATHFDDAGSGSVAFVLDLTERKQAEERIRYMADHDALTGLPNRTLLQDRVRQAMAVAHRSGMQLALLFIDLDYFKHINDSLGHRIGDTLLQMAAVRLQHCVREGDTVARLGGDEFVLCLPLTVDSNDAALAAQKVLLALEQPFLFDGRELHISGSIGISLYPNDGADVETLMRTADAALYHAKEKGRGNYQFFTPSLNLAVQRRLELGNALRHALARGELALYYQPQVDMARSAIVAAEALLRWRQPGKAPISCQEFIAIAEETGLIVQISEWVLREACRQLKRWHELGHDALQIAVNLSPRQFHQPDLSNRIRDIVAQSGIPPTSLDLEITENILMQRSDDNIATLKQLSDMGIKLSIDDFGTGYSSLSYLQRFPVDALKIDRAFVQHIGHSASDTALVTAIISMARSLRLGVLAEGVETPDQVQFLLAHGCRAAQGFYYSEAVPAERFADLLRRQRTA